MTTFKGIVAGLALALSTFAPAKAQVTLDMAKITCEQFLLFQVADPQHIAIWIHGYYAGKKDTTIVEVQALKEAANKVREGCRSDMKAPVMTVVEKLFGPPR